MENKKILIAGLHDTGKTTFIAALWYFVYLSTEKKHLTLDSLAQGEHEYLNNICNDWLTYQQVARTSNIAKGEPIEMNLKNVKTGELVCLEIPDFSGEAFKIQFENREWTLEYDKMLDDINGIILFVNPAAANNRPVLVYDANDAALLMGAEQLISNDGVELKPWVVENCPNQVKLVDILQFIAQYKPHTLPLKIAVVISAWDKLEPVDQRNSLTPAKWLESNLPLFFQYLHCNPDLFDCKYVGISAQGCDYENVQQVEKVIEKDPYERIILKEGNDYHNDITKYIVWVTE